MWNRFVPMSDELTKGCLVVVAVSGFSGCHRLKDDLVGMRGICVYCSTTIDRSMNESGIIRQHQHMPRECTDCKSTMELDERYRKCGDCAKIFNLSTLQSTGSSCPVVHVLSVMPVPSFKFYS
jgi:hypothetical protein